jgi:hypothetical protein
MKIFEENLNLLEDIAKSGLCIRTGKQVEMGSTSLLCPRHVFPIYFYHGIALIRVALPLRFNRAILNWLKGIVPV